MADDGMRLLIDDGIIIWFDGPEWDDVAAEAFDKAALNIKTYAQNNAPWTDRTGDARKLLDTAVELDKGEVTLLLGHGVEYGKWLELIQDGRFAIIMDTLEQYAPVVIASTIARLKTAREGRN